MRTGKFIYSSPISIEDDVRDQETVEKLLKGLDVVVHQAAKAGVRESVANPRTVTEINIDGTVNLLEASTAVPG